MINFMKKSNKKNKLVNFFKDKDGKIVIGQFPNWPLFLAGGFYILGYLDNELAKTISSYGVFTAMIYWSYLEIFFGVNSWRKLLGLIVAIMMIKPLLLSIF